MNKNLNEQRRQAADHVFESAEIGAIEDTGCWEWTSGSNIWSRRVYWKNEATHQPSIAGSFGVEFVEGSNKVVEFWTN